MTLPMTWDEWAQHDGTAFAARVRKGEVMPAELAAQGLSQALIEPQSNRVEITLRDAREIGSSRKVLTSRPLVFSFGPRCQGLRGSQK
jgi:hypothetical protein